MPQPDAAAPSPRELAAALAPHLADGPWTVAPPRALEERCEHFARIFSGEAIPARPDEDLRAPCLLVGFDFSDRSRVAISGAWPRIPGRHREDFSPRYARDYRITVNPCRPVPALAADVSRRLVGMYLRAFREQLALALAFEARESAAGALALDLAVALGAERRERNDGGGWRVSVRGGEGGVDVEATVDTYGEVQFVLDLPASHPGRRELALTVARQFAAWAEVPR
jgi:hypothetical protein